MTSLKTTEVDIVDVEPRIAAIVRKTVPLAEIPEAQRVARQTLNAALAAADVTPNGPTLTVWRMPEGGAMDYAPGVFVPDVFVGSDEVTRFALPAGRAAHVEMTGSYERLPEAWGRLFETCRNRSLSGLCWEVYTAQDEAGGDNRTDLYALLD